MKKDITNKSEKDFLEATAETFDSLADKFERIKKLIETDKLNTAKKECAAAMTACAHCAGLTNARIDANN